MFNHKWPIIKILTYIHMLKFGLFEKHTKFEKIFFMVLTNELIYLVKVNQEEDFFSNYVCFSKSPNFTRNAYIERK